MQNWQWEREKKHVNENENCKVHKFLHWALRDAHTLTHTHTLNAADTTHPPSLLCYLLLILLQSKINAHFCVISLFTYYITHKYKYNNNTEILKSRPSNLGQLSCKPGQLTNQCCQESMAIHISIYHLYICMYLQIYL